MRHEFTDGDGARVAVDESGFWIDWGSGYRRCEDETVTDLNIEILRLAEENRALRDLLGEILDGGGNLSKESARQWLSEHPATSAPAASD